MHFSNCHGHGNNWQLSNRSLLLSCLAGCGWKWDGDVGPGTRGRMFGDVGCGDARGSVIGDAVTWDGGCGDVSSQKRGREDVKRGKRGREIGESCSIAEKRKRWLKIDRKSWFLTTKQRKHRLFSFQFSQTCQSQIPFFPNFVRGQHGGGTHLSEGLTGLAEKTKEQTIKQWP